MREEMTATVEPVSWGRILMVIAVRRNVVLETFEHHQKYGRGARRSL